MEPEYCYCCGRLLEDIKQDCIDLGVMYDCGLLSYMHHEYSPEYDTIYPLDSTLHCCEYCGEPLARDDIIVKREPHEFWGAPCSEELVVGYHCHSCGKAVRL